MHSTDNSDHLELKNYLTLEIIEDALSGKKQIQLNNTCLDSVQKTADYIAKKVNEGAIIYGVTTGFGANSHRVIDKIHAKSLQKNLLLSHASGVGEPFSPHIVKTVLLLRIVNFLHGYSGVRPELVNRLVDMFNNDIIPVVPIQGSVGASGDLAPLSHVGITLLGEGEVFYKGQRRSSMDVFQELGWEPLELTYKEGLALNNGTTFIEAIGIHNIIAAKRILLRADSISALTIESLGGRSEAFDHKPHDIRPHKGQIMTAANIRSLLKGSELFGIEISRIKGKRNATQDSYSLRCIPQVHGASKNAYQHIQEIIMTEANSVTDNPLIFTAEDQVISAGNFHGQPLALVMDYLKIAIAELGNISERRSAKLVDTNHNEGLPPFLVGNDNGQHNGFMIPQYAAAALVSENKVLCHPASCDSIPTSANIEDHVSMGTIAARQANEIIGNVYNVLAIELLEAAQALDLRLKSDGQFKLGVGTSMLYHAIRKEVSFMDVDRYLSPDISKAAEFLKTSSTLDELIEATGISV